MPLLAHVATFSEQLHFWRIYFFTVSASSEQLDFKSNYFDSKITFFKQLFLQSCYSFGTATFQMCHFYSAVIFFFGIGTFLQRTSTVHLTIENRELFRTATFQEDELVQNKDIYKRATFWKEVLRCSMKFFRTATFSTNVILQRRTF